MNPLGIRPHLLLTDQIISDIEGNRIFFRDQPLQEIKCYDKVQGAALAALGIAVPFYNRSTLYYVDKQSLMQALELTNAAITDDELNTELMWRLVLKASEKQWMKAPPIAGAKEYLIGSFYASKNEAEESNKWMQAALDKGYLIPKLPGKTCLTDDEIVALEELARQGDGEAAYRLFIHYDASFKNGNLESMKNREEMLIQAARLGQTDALRCLVEKANSGEDFLYILTKIAHEHMGEQSADNRGQPGFDEYAIGLLLARDPALKQEAELYFTASLNKDFTEAWMMYGKLQEPIFLKLIYYVSALNKGCKEVIYLFEELARQGEKDVIQSLFNEQYSNKGMSDAVKALLIDLASKFPNIFEQVESMGLSRLLEKDREFAIALIKILYAGREKSIERIIHFPQSFSVEELELYVIELIDQTEDRSIIKKIQQSLTDLIRKTPNPELKRIYEEIYIKATIHAWKKIDVNKIGKAFGIAHQVIQYAEKGYSSAMEGIKILAASGSALAQRYIHPIEFLETVLKFDFSEFCSTSLDRAFESYMEKVTHLRKEYLITYLVPADLRSKFYSETGSLCDQIQENDLFFVLRILTNPECRLAFWNRCVHLFFSTKKESLKRDIGEIILNSYSWILEIDEETVNSYLPKIIRELTTITGLELDLLHSVPRITLLEILSMESLSLLERKAIDSARELVEGHEKVIQYFRRLLGGGPRFFEIFSEEVLYSAKEHGKHVNDLVALALKGNLEALKILMNLDPCYHQEKINKYRLFSTIIFNSAAILSDTKLIDEIAAITTSENFDELLKFYAEDHRTSFLDPVDPYRNERNEKFELIVMLAATRFPKAKYLSELEKLALDGSSAALTCLEQIAEKNQEAGKHLAEYRFLKFSKGATIETLRSQAFDQFFEDLFQFDSASLTTLAYTLYLLPPQFRLAWIADLKEPLQLLESGAYQYEDALNDKLIREALLANVPHCLDKQIPDGLKKILCIYVMENSALLGIDINHPAYVKATEVFSALELEGPKNHIAVLNRLKELMKTPVEFVPPAQIVEGKSVSFNLPVIQQINKAISFPKELLHPDVTWEKWCALIQQIAKKQSDPQVVQAVQERSIGGWQALYGQCLSDNDFFLGRLEFNCDKVPFNIAQLNAILHKIFNLKDNGNPLTQKEEALIVFAESVKNCAGGKFEGISLFYVGGLEEGDRFPITIENEPDLAKARAKSVLADEFQKFISHQFSGDNALMKELTGVINGKEASEEQIRKATVSQVAHQSIYLKNLIGPIVGLMHNLQHDLYTGTLYDVLLNCSREEVLEIFFKYCSPAALVDHMHSWMNRDSEITGRKYWDEVFQLVTPSEDDVMEWDEDFVKPITVSQGYARKILESAGYLLDSQDKQD